MKYIVSKDKFRPVLWIGLIKDFSNVQKRSQEMDFKILEKSTK